MENPLIDKAPEEIHLGSAPLVRVLVAIQFPPVMKIADPSGAGISQFQTSIQSRYPIAIQETQQVIELAVSPDASDKPAIFQEPLWRFFDEAEEWRVSLLRDSLSLEVQTAYPGRRDFLARFREIAQAAQACFKPAFCVRIGARYVNALPEKQLSSLSGLVQPEIRTFGEAPFVERVIASHQQVEFSVPEGQLVIRSGFMPANVVHDPNVMLPKNERRFLLDFDVFTLDRTDFDSAAIHAKTEALSERIYTMFRWCVTSSFMEALK